MTKAKFKHPLGLKLSQMRIIRDCIWAWTQISNGHYLPAPGLANMTRDLIKRGYVTEVKDAKFSPHYDDWIVIVMHKENGEKYNADLKAACIEQGIPFEEETKSGEAQG